MMSMKAVQAVQERHQGALLAVEGVVGVAIGALEDGTFCLQVYVREKTAEVERKIPPVLEGCPVVLEVTDPIRPMESEGH
jgi:hypothetical protein